MDDLSELILAVAGFITACATVFAAWNRRKAVEAEEEVEQIAQIHLQQIPDKLKFLADWSLFEGKVVQLLHDSEIDRFIFFRCWNGLYDPKWTTAIYQYREGEQDRFTFKLVPLDEDYLVRFLDMKTNGYHEIEVDDMPPSLIKKIYDAEGLNRSIWYHVRSEQLTDRLAAHAYFSAATHNKEPISDGTKAKLQDLAWDLSKILERVEHED